MYALQSPNSRPQPVKRSRTVSRSRPRSYPRSHRVLAFETTVKLAVNVVLSTAALTAVSQLLPYRTSQEAKLQEVQVAVESAGERFQKSQSRFSRYFDPYQARAIMQEQTNRIDPERRQIILQGPRRADVNQVGARQVDQSQAKGY